MNAHLQLLETFKTFLQLLETFKTFPARPRKKSNLYKES